ncbi:MAG: hypothetical protein IMW93_00535 [Thermoanaerobacteraceae bacterium]|nr:hypothetical protein [Thermoanaerobacteraceae bacterium]
MNNKNPMLTPKEKWVETASLIVDVTGVSLIISLTAALYMKAFCNGLYERIAGSALKLAGALW